ncbi:MAG: hypothetical protein ABSA93_26440 [Streptosporangiaceae bacterium]
MSYANRIKPRIAAAALAAGALAISGVTLAASPAPAAVTEHKTVLHLHLSPMPQGTVSAAGHAVTVRVSGLTPGSAHIVETVEHAGATVLGTLTANSVGQASATFTAATTS